MNKTMLKSTKVDVSLEPINGLEPVRSQPESNHIYNDTILITTYRCKECGAVQLVLINPKTHKPLMNPHCYNRFCNNYGYKDIYNEHLEKYIGNFKHIIPDIKLMVIKVLSEDKLLCLDINQLLFMVLDIEMLL